MHRTIEIEDFTIRQATAADKEDVFRIHTNVYDGMDYIAEYYDDFIANPLTTPYVACIDGKIVGFVAIFIVDDGKTAVTRAGRLSPSVGGQGLYKKLKSHVLRESGARTHALMAVNANQGTKKESFNTTNKHIMTKPFVRFLFDARDVNTITHDVQDLKTPSDDELKSYMSKDELRSYLFKRERMIVDWVPYRLLLGNVDLLRKTGQRTKVYSDVSRDQKGRGKGLLSFSATFRVNRPAFGSNLDIYGTDYHTTTLKDHVIAHIRHIREVTDGVTSLLVCVEPEFDMRELDKVFGEIGLQRNDWHETGHPERVYSEQMLFEKDI